MSGVPNNMNRMVFLVELNSDYMPDTVRLVVTTDHWETKQSMECGVIDKPFDNSDLPSEMWGIQMIHYELLERFFDYVKLGFYFDGVQYAKQDNQG